MAITFRHDAAAVALPSNSATRKYGQNLVLQQNQQKYNAQQAGYDRLFTMGRDQQQATAAAIRQGQQNAANTIRDVNQNVNLQARQDAQNKFLLEQQQAEQQQKFMEDARKQSSGMIMEDIKNEQYDPATARKLQQNLVAESEALGNPGLDATQRAEALAKIRAERTMLTANRMDKPPKAPPQPNFHTDPNGNQWVESGPGKWEQVPQQQKAPKSASEAFAADPKLKDKYLKDARDILTADDRPLSRGLLKEADDLAMQLWEDSNRPAGYGSTSSAGYYNAPVSGAPTPKQTQAAAPAVPSGGASTASSFTEQAEAARRELKEADDAINYDLDKETQRKNMDRRSKAIDNAMKFFPELKTEIDAVNALETGDLTPEEYNAGQDRFHSFFNSVIDGTFKPSDTTAAVPTKGQPQDQGMPPSPPTQNPWKEVATPPAAEPLPEYQAAMDQLGGAAKSQASIIPPDFTKLSEGANKSDLEELQSMKDVYSGLPPNAQQAMSVILSDSSTKEQKAAANKSLLQMGINLQEELSKRTVKPDYHPSYADSNYSM